MLRVVRSAMSQHRLPLPPPRAPWKVTRLFIGEWGARSLAQSLHFGARTGNSLAPRCKMAAASTETERETKKIKSMTWEASERSAYRGHENIGGKESDAFDKQRVDLLGRHPPLSTVLRKDRGGGNLRTFPNININLSTH